MLVMALVMSLSACKDGGAVTSNPGAANGASSKTAEDLPKEFTTFEEAVEANEAMEKSFKSYRIKSNTDMKMTYEGTEISVKSEEDTVCEKIGTDTEFSIYIDFVQDNNGVKTNTSTFSDTKKQYMKDAAGAWMETGEAPKVDETDAMVKEIGGKLEKVSDGYTLTVDLSGDEFIEKITKFMGFEEVMSVTKVETFVIVLKIDNNARPVNTSTEFKITMKVEGVEMPCEGKMIGIYSDFNTAKITVPDINGAQTGNA